jgi:hypothetical protein
LNFALYEPYELSLRRNRTIFPSQMRLR